MGVVSCKIFIFFIISKSKYGRCQSHFEHSPTLSLLFHSLSNFLKEFRFMRKTAGTPSMSLPRADVTTTTTNSLKRKIGTD